MKRIFLITFLFGVTTFMGKPLIQQENLTCLYYMYASKRHEFCYNEDRSVFTNRELTDDLGFIITTPEGEEPQ